MVFHYYLRDCICSGLDHGGHYRAFILNTGEWNTGKTRNLDSVGTTQQQGDLGSQVEHHWCLETSFTFTSTHIIYMHSHFFRRDSAQIFLYDSSWASPSSNKTRMVPALQMS